MNAPGQRWPEIDDLFREFFSTNRGPGYGVSVTSAAPDRSTIEVEFRFLASRSYCCAEPGCHLPRDCERLIRLAAERSIHLPEGVAVRWHCIVEEGASLRCRRAPVVAKAYEYDMVTEKSHLREIP